VKLNVALNQSLGLITKLATASVTAGEEDHPEYDALASSIKQARSRADGATAGEKRANMLPIIGSRKEVAARMSILSLNKTRAPSHSLS